MKTSIASGLHSRFSSIPCMRRC